MIIKIEQGNRRLAVSGDYRGLNWWMSFHHDNGGYLPVGYESDGGRWLIAHKHTFTTGEGSSAKPIAAKIMAWCFSQQESEFYLDDKLVILRYRFEYPDTPYYFKWEDIYIFLSKKEVEDIINHIVQYFQLNELWIPYCT